MVKMKKPYFGSILIQRMSNGELSHSTTPYYGMWNSPVEARQQMEEKYRAENPGSEFQVMKFNCQIMDEDFCLAAAGYFLEQKGKL
jgi:hypothetical protein